MATAQAIGHETGFAVGAADVRFGVLWADAALLADWGRESRVATLAGPNGFTETQLLGFGPRTATYALFLDAVADFRALADLVQATGTLTLVHGAHTLPLDAAGDGSYYLPQTGLVYDRLAGVTLLSLASTGVAADGSVEASALFARGTP